MKIKINILVTLILSISLINCSSNEKNEVKPSTDINEDLIEISKEQFFSSNLKIGLLSEQKFNETVKTNGLINVAPSNKAMISTLKAGYIKTIPFLVGSNVNKGQIIATIENPSFIEIQKEYLKTKEELAFLKVEYERQLKLFNEKITSEKNYKKAESDYKSAKASFQAFEKQLKLLHINLSNVSNGNFTSTLSIYAPISGTVVAVNGSIGKYVSESETILEIVNDLDKHLELTVFEKDILKVKKGQAIEFTVPETSTLKYNATVSLVGKSINQNRTIKLYGKIIEKKSNLLVGMFVEAEIITNSINKMALPSGSIVEEEGEFYALQLINETSENYQFKKISVQIDAKNEEFVALKKHKEFLKSKFLLTNNF